MAPHRTNIRRLTTGLCGLALAGASVLVGSQAAGAADALPAKCAQNPDGSVTCRYINDTMSVQQFTVPIGVSSIHVTVSGAPGGDSAAAKGGRGATVDADLAVRLGQTLYIAVGDYGSNRQDGQGGMNGGGAAGSIAAGGGGGATDISWSPGRPNTPGTSIVVAGGGGGAGTTYPGGDAGMPGGGGGGGGAGTATAGGIGGTGTPGGTPGLFQQGGNGAHSGADDGGGGGGGLYGGGGGGVNYGGGGAGGGASLVPAGGTVTTNDTGPAVTIVYTPGGSPWGSLGNLFGGS
ncbi:glycine-rich protein [Rhodococcus sp. NPDC127528]|uniref:glycine-rich protein n=1 Tax=unclassified Rhodococcus (in: high G+C Gram-positive bacteria) TaxID=192944 RepID=UPI0036414484